MIHNAQHPRKDDLPLDHMVEVLICDDDPSIREALKSLFSTYALSKPDDSASNIKVVGEAANGQEALYRIAKYQPDVVLMDAHMPVMDGFEAARAIKTSWPQVKVVMLTINSSLEQAALTAGVDAFLLKGGAVDKMIDTILMTAKPDREHA